MSSEFPRPSAFAGRLAALHARGEFSALIDEARRDPAALAGDPAASLYFGLACASSGAFAEAATALARALEAQPANCAIMGALARVLILGGEAEKAEPLISDLAAAAVRDPAAAEALAETHLQAGRAEEAFHALAAAAGRFGHGVFHARLAEAAIRTRRIDLGVSAARRAETMLGAHACVVNVAGPAALLAGDEAWFERQSALVAAAPAAKAVTTLDHWTSVLLAGGHHAAARRAAELAAARAPSARRWRLVSDLRLATRDVRGAEEAARAALLINSRDADAFTLLARVKNFQGDIAEAKRLLLEAVTLDPDSATAFDNLTQIDATALTPEMAARLEKRLGDGGLSPDSRSRALLALARRGEADGDYERAFARVLEAKKTIADAARAGGQGYDPAETDTSVARLVSAFPRFLAAGPAAHERLTFVVGMPRSGTSLVEQIIASHPDAFGAGELSGMSVILGDFLSAVPSRKTAEVLAARAPAWIDSYRSDLPLAAAAGRMIVDKHPLNFWSVGLIRALFPDARIVNLVRAPVDTCLSILRVRFFAKYSFANEIDSVAHYFAAYERMMTHWRAVFRDAIHDVDYARLIADSEGETRALLDFCGLDWDENCLAFHKTKREVLTHSAAQVREPLHTRGVERRKRYGDSLKPLEDALARYGVSPR